MHIYIYIERERERDFPGGATGKEPACQCRRHKRPEFNPWVRKSPWRRTLATHSSIPRTSLVAQIVRNLSAMWETWVQSPGQENPLEKGKATHSSILPWRIPWTEEPGRLQSMGSQRVRQ